MSRAVAAPLRDERRSSGPRGRSGKRKAATPEQRGTGMDNANVFLIEDDETLAYALRRYLESEGLTVATFATAEAFLRAFSGEQRGCLVVDLVLPGVGGGAPSPQAPPT